jgi:hypothetical protein
LAIHRQDKTTGSQVPLDELTVALTPPPANVNIHYTQGRKQGFDYYLVVAGNIFPAFSQYKTIISQNLIGKAFQFIGNQSCFSIFHKRTGLH